MGIIAKYKFNQEIYADFVPEFNSEFTDYTITDEIDTDGYTIRTIESDNLPTLMKFGVITQTDREKSLLEVYECNTEKVTNMNQMFQNCSSLTSLNVSNFNTEKVTNMNQMFQNCSSLTSLNVSNFNTEKVTNMNQMFQNCSSLTSLNVSNFNTENVINMNQMFGGCSSLTSLNVSNFNTENVINMNQMFGGCSSLTSLNVSNFNTQNVTNMGNMFQNCSLLTSLDVSNFNVSQVMDMQSMFYGCSSLASLDLSNWNTDKMNNMYRMFNNCSSLTSLNLSNFNTEKVTSMAYMVDGCSSLTSLDISNFNTEKVTHMGYMFRRCSSLTSLDISNFNTEKVTNMSQMVFGCSSLTSLDISNFNTEKVTDMGWIVRDCPKLTDIGMIYCNSSAINKILDSNSITTNTTIWYQDANISDLTVKDNITYKKYKSTTLSLNEPIQLRSIGDVHDEINYETGEYIQRIGECIYEDDLTPTYNGQIGGYFDSMKVKGIIGLEVAYGMGAISDKLINQNFTNHDFGIYGNLNGNLNIFDKTVKSGEEFINKYRGTKFQFILLEPIITKIDTTILDQNNSYKSSQQTYNEQTYVSVQSDTVVTPTSSVDYEIYSSTGTVNGTSATIENAEAGTPVSGVVYGETLLNVIQEPSEDEFVCLGEYSGTNITIEDSVEGNIKSAILKGNTKYRDIDTGDILDTFDETKNLELVSVKMPVLTTVGKNLFDFKTWKSTNGQVVIDNGNFHTIPSARGWFVVPVVIGKKYTLSYTGKNSENTDYGLELYGTSNPNSTPYAEWDLIGASRFKTPNEMSLAQLSFTAKYPYVIVFHGALRSIDFSDIQLKQGSVVTSYEPYKSNILTVNEEVELRGIGDVKDEMDLITGELTQRIGEVVFDGSEDWQIDSDTNDYRLALALKHNGEMLKYTQSICDRYPTKTGKQSDTTYNYVYIGSHSINLYENPSMTLEEFKSKLKQNPMTFQYQFTTESVKTVDLSILDQDNTPTTFHSYDIITHINTSSDYLKPTLEITNPTYDVILKPNTEYTIKTNRTNRATLTSDIALDVNLGGSTISMDSVTNHVKVTTPSTLENNTLTLSGFGNKVKDIMVIEGDYVDRDLDFFEGFISVENPILSTTGKNLVFLDKNNPNALGSISGSGSSTIKYDGEKQAFYTDTHRSMCSNIAFKPNTYYIISAEFLLRKYSSYSFNWSNPHQSTGSTYSSDTPFNETTWIRKSIKRLSNNNGKIGWIAYGGVWFRNLQIEEAESLTEYEPYQGNTLTTYPQITLRSMGDIKDELDVVGETVTRRIGKIVLDGSEEIRTTNNGVNVNKIVFKEKLYYQSSGGDDCNYLMCDKLRCVKYSSFADRLYDFISIGTSGMTNYESAIFIKFNSATTVDEWKGLYSQITPITLYYQLETPTTESVRITPPNPQTSSASITIPTQLNHVEDTSDFLVWNPYKEHYVRYNYVEDGVVLDNYTWENLTDLNERQFVEFYNKRTYVDQPYHNYVASHGSKGTSKYVLIEPNQDYTVSVRFSELPTCETVKVNLGGAEVEMNVNDPHVHVTTPNTLVNNLCSISGNGLDGKVTDILVIHCLEHEGFADVEYFEGIDGIGEIVEVDGVSKVNITMEQTNGNLLDLEPVVFNNGNYVSMGWDDTNKAIPIHPNKEYVFKLPKRFDNEWGDYGLRLFDSNFNQTRTISNSSINNWRRFIIIPTPNEKYIRAFAQFSMNGETHCHVPVELCYADMEKDYIRPRYYGKEEILLPMQLHRINTVYDNFYYDEMKGYYRIQQSIGHKYFVGADSENWTLIEKGQRVLRFRYNNADIQMKSLGEFMTNRLPNGTATSPYECCAFNGINFIVSIDKERLSSESLTAFKEWLANNNLHLYYQLASPLMIDLPEYSSRIEFNTYKDEIYTFFKNCKPTVFTLGVPLDQTYRFYELEQGEGYANRVELTDERMTEEDTLYINTIYGSGIGNLIEEPNNVDTMLKPNYEGKATSHSLTNGKVSTIGVHGFEPNNVTISNYNTVTKQYELTVQAQQGTNTNTKVLPIPYKFEVYEDGTKDKVYYNSQYKQWMFEGGQTLTVPYNASTGAFTNAVEVFRGLQPRSGLIGEFKVRFASGTTSARLYYSINGTTYGYTTLRGMTDEVDYYIGFFNTGGTKIDMGTKIDVNAEYTTLVPINATVPECLMINQIQSITECTYYQDKTYYYSDVVSPLLLDVYNGTTTITELNGAVIDIQNNAHNKQALIYGDTTYTVYWTYVGGEGNIKVTLGGVTQEVFAPQGYVTITTSDTDLEKGLFIGGFNVTIKDLMLVKGERIENLKYFEGSRAVGTAFTDENGETMYKITLVTGSELINDKFEETITFEDNKKHNVVVTKLLGAKPDKI